MSEIDDLLDPSVRETKSGNVPQEKLPNFIAILVLGIVSIVGCYPFGIPGLICGIIALSLWNKNNRLYQSNPDHYASYSYRNAKAGRVCAIIGICVSSAWILFFLFAIVLGNGLRF